jgi:hypothetical protein
MTPRIERAIDTFLDALNEGTLAKGVCTACAVGNLVAKGAGIKIHKDDLEMDHAPIGATNLVSDWVRAFCTYDNYQKVYLDKFNSPNVVRSVSQTEFTIEELMQIEFAFESNTKLDVCDYTEYSSEEIFQDQLRGLEEVINVMMTFDDCNDNIEEVFTSKAIENYEKSICKV